MAAPHAPHNVIPGKPLESARTRCLALFSPRKGAWHRSHRALGRPTSRHRRGRSPSICVLATPPMVRRSGASHREATQKAGAPGHHPLVTLNKAASEAAQSEDPHRSGSAPLAKNRFVPSGDLSTRSRTLSLKMTRLQGAAITSTMAARRIGFTPPSVSHR